MIDLDAWSEFGWWARFEFDNGDLTWLARSYSAGQTWKITEDPEQAHQFGSPGAAWDALKEFNTYSHQGRWNVVEFQDSALMQETSIPN